MAFGVMCPPSDATWACAPKPLTPWPSASRVIAIMDLVTVITLLNLSGEPIETSELPAAVPYATLEACQEAVKKHEQWMNKTAEATHQKFRFSWNCKTKP
jgi:hypothetical protein